MRWSDRESAGRRNAEAADFSDYVAALTGELAREARVRGLDMLGYLLEMARLEAGAVAASAPQDRSSAPAEELAAEAA